VCKGCADEDDEPALICSETCFKTAHFALRNNKEAMEQHSLHRKKCDLEDCEHGAEFTSCATCTADQYCKQCKIMACGSCMESLHRVLQRGTGKFEAHDVISAQEQHDAEDPVEHGEQELGEDVQGTTYTVIRDNL
jgi:hypothetical protein